MMSAPKILRATNPEITLGVFKWRWIVVTGMKAPRKTYIKFPNSTHRSWSFLKSIHHPMVMDPPMPSTSDQLHLA